ncbi:MAG: DNA replication/repair protein RecF [Lachnospiraceae bacterium]|nr:DNA replication/repair protein RecF [Lachnospiraceae bacterium]
MFIESIELLNYRNYDTLHMNFHEGTNVLYGDNAQGKTNILEAIYVCSTTKSHRGSRDKEIVRFGQEESHIKMLVKKDGIPHRIDMHLKKNRPKGVAVNGIPIRKASELFGIVNVIFFSPEDLNLIKNGPAERRRFVDLELCQLDRLYVHNLVQYNRVVVQRNRLLKEIDFHPSLEETLSVWDEQLMRYGKELIRIRASFIRNLNDLLYEIHFHLSGEREDLSIWYEPNVQIESFEESLAKNRPQELRQRLTLTGPHRDDLNFIINGTDIRKYGSQGQQRTAALSLKLAEIELVKKTVKDYPILLLDDVLSELDSKRQEHLLSEINRIQTVITCTGLDEFVNSRFQMDRIFQIVDGTVESVR